MPTTQKAALLQNFHCPRWQQLPTLSLYMDQVLIVLEETLAIFTPAGERPITAAMINNYVKHKLVPPPEKKKYTNRHLASLIVISILKNVLSMAEIEALIDKVSAEHGEEKAYNLFCDELEVALASAFGKKQTFIAPLAGCQTPANAMQAAIAAFANKLLVQLYLAAAHNAQEKNEK
ncbi:DUF1836 domain-containing protein [Ruminococcaceae bacterium OttesenSCG-928-A16]|nr:DUF1836 domain-containing protein [Ruminococcaceae bacterium OttesenSCG-928-A16]